MKGRNTKENMHRNFGMARPEGYRKATRLMRVALCYKCPIIHLLHRHAVPIPGSGPRLAITCSAFAIASACPRSR
jgi:acetyl-CoA carboxylase carboxyl transferase subunit alpha